MSWRRWASEWRQFPARLRGHSTCRLMLATQRVMGWHRELEHLQKGLFIPPKSIPVLPLPQKRSYFAWMTLYERVFLTDLRTVQFSRQLSQKVYPLALTLLDVLREKRSFPEPIHHHPNVPSLCSPWTVENRTALNTLKDRNRETKGSPLSFNAEQHWCVCSNVSHAWWIIFKLKLGAVSPHAILHLFWCRIHLAFNSSLLCKKEKKNPQEGRQNTQWLHP